MLPPAALLLIILLLHMKLRLGLNLVAKPSVSVLNHCVLMLAETLLHGAVLVVACQYLTVVHYVFVGFLLNSRNSADQGI